MEHAAGDAVVVMDADLQDPPEVVLDLAAKWREGFDIVYAARISREGESRLKLWTASLFYALIRKLTAVDIPANVGDFRLVDRKAVDAFRSMPERDRFVRGMFSWMGFSQTSVAFHRASRKAGRSNYGWSKMIKLAGDGIIGFSDVPAAPRAVARGPGVAGGARLRRLGHDHGATRRAFRVRLGLDDRAGVAARRPQPPDDRSRRHLRRTHPHRGERPPAFRGRAQGRLRRCRGPAGSATAPGSG